MGFFKHFKKKSKKLSIDKQRQREEKYYNSSHNGNGYGFYVSPPRQDFTQNLPASILSRIFGHVCPHALDGSLNSSEETMTEDGCMLCDMRDLAHSALVCRRWHDEAQKLLYTHVRIDPVHYCELEITLAAKRKKNSFLNHNAEPLDAPRTRLLLFMRTVRESQSLANLVLSLRMPYMTREASKAELARTVSVLPHLRYVDLPAGVFSDDASSNTLKQELMARCPEIRRMKYARGAEGSFARIPQGRRWVNLEVLELVRLGVEPDVILLALNCFRMLKDLKLDDLRWLDDAVFRPVPNMPQMPPIERLTLHDTPNISVKGFAAYLSEKQNRAALKHLSLSNTGVRPAELHEILSRAPRLVSLSITQEVSQIFPMEQIPPLSSRSLRLLHYEITSPASSYGVQPVSASYYTYLMSSLLSGSLPSLRDLYVRDAHFPETLLLAPPPRFGAGGAASQLPPGLNQNLNVYSKGIDELEWNFTAYEPDGFGFGGGAGGGGAGSRRSSVTRPVSFHGASLSPAWGGEARRSVLVGNGFGGFLAVPADEERPKSSGTWRNGGGKAGDLWR